MKVGTLDITGNTLDIDASSSGLWTLRRHEEDGRGEILGSGDTLEKAKAQARTKLAQAKVKVSVPFVVAETGQRGVATGIHARDRKVLARMDDGEAVQINGYAGILSPDIPEEVLNALVAAQDQIRRSKTVVAKIEREYALSLRHAVERAIEEAVAAKEAAA